MLTGVTGRTLSGGCGSSLNEGSVFYDIKCVHEGSIVGAGLYEAFSHNQQIVFWCFDEESPCVEC